MLQHAATGQQSSRVHTQVVLGLQRLVLALGTESPKTHAVLLPALQYATDPAGPEALALLEVCHNAESA